MEFGHILCLMDFLIMNNHELQGQVVDCCASMDLNYIHNEH